MQNFGNVMSGIGAGLLGQSPQWEESQRQNKDQQMFMQEKQQAMAIQRAKAGFQDAMAMERMIEQGDYAAIVGLTQKRMEYLPQLGAKDNKDSQRIQELAVLAAKGDKKAQDFLKKENQGMLKMGATYFPDMVPQRKGPNTDIGKAKQDVDNGWMTPEQFAGMQQGGIDAAQVKSSKILEDGTAIMVMNNGQSVVLDSAGKQLTGEARGKAIKDSNSYGADLQSDRAGGRTRATKQETRASDLIDRGISAAESTGTIRRAITLLDTVETGGMAAVSLAMKQKFGIEGADEGELSNSLGKAVLSQLKETFGAAFTVEEGKRLERIEAGFTKSPATNKRLLSQSLRIAERTAKRALEAAKARGDDATVQDIEELLSSSLDVEQSTPQQVAPASSKYKIEVL